MMNMLFGFQGRIGRSSWWLAQLVAIPIVYLLGFGMLMGTAGVMEIDNTAVAQGDPSPAAGGSMFLIIVLAVIVGIWINAASTVKRFHDRGKSGMWFFIVFIPFIGGFWQLIECGFCTGDDGANDYGPPSGSGRYGSDDAPGMAATPTGGLAKLDDDYFRKYAAQAQQRAHEPVVQSTYARPSATVTSAPAFGNGKPVFGRR